MPDQLDESGLIKFAERILTLLDRGSFVATYKYAVMLGLMDLCLEETSKMGAAPTMVTSRQLTEKVLETYWPHTVPYDCEGSQKVLKQNTGAQAKILTDIAKFKERLSIPLCSLWQGRRQAPEEYEQLVWDVEWTLILMPLPRVQVIGRQEDRLIYDIAWDLGIERNRRIVTEYQRTGGGPFDNRIVFKPGVGEYLVALSGLLRPLIHREWVSMVAQINSLEESRLEKFLFGIDRRQMNRIKPVIVELQNCSCFYCRTEMMRGAEVDHFVPWSRYPDNGIENLVAAHASCNRAKRDFLASAEHVANWSARNTSGSSGAGALASVADAEGWETHPRRTLGIARAVYLRLPEEAKLWQIRDEFVSADRDALHSALGADWI